MIHLDTSFLIPALIPDTQQDWQVRNWVSEGEAIVISAVAWAEFLCGPLSRSDLDAALQIVELHSGFTVEHAAVAARLFNDTGRRRRTFVDCLIAAVAVSESARLATSNPADFRRFAEYGLQLA